MIWDWREDERDYEEEATNRALMEEHDVPPDVPPGMTQSEMLKYDPPDYGKISPGDGWS